MFYHFNVLKYYLYTAARNACLTYVTRQCYQNTAKKNQVSLTRGEEKSIVVDIIRAQVMKNIKMVIGELPSRTHQVLQLIFFKRKKDAWGCSNSGRFSPANPLWRTLKANWRDNGVGLVNSP